MNRSYHIGWDYFTPAPGTKQEMRCRVCDAVMDVERCVNGPTGSIGAMLGRKHLYDAFSCPYNPTSWHMQVLRLKKRINEECSLKIADILQEEVNEILICKRVTKEVY